MIKKFLITLCFSLPIISTAQISFTNSSSSLNNSNLTSGTAIGISDMNGDGLDDIVRLDNASDLEIEYQNIDGVFTHYDYGNLGSSNEWGLCIADVDKNGYNDILAGGPYNGIKLLKANGDGTSYSSTILSDSNIFLQSVNFADIDNNGTIDIFACNDDGLSRAYSNDGSGNMTFNNDLISCESSISSDNSGNYGSIWIDYDNDNDLDLYISKCRLGVNNPEDGRRTNLLFQNDGNNNYTEVAESVGLRPLGQSWAANFEDIDNDGDLDCVIINHDITSMILENDGMGNFTNITDATGIASELNNLDNDGIQLVMQDFDNDTFIDLMITAKGGSHYLFKNNGDQTFSTVPSPFSGSRIQSAVSGDLNNDGLMDIVAAYASSYNSPSNTPDRLFFNTGNTVENYNWSEIRLQGGPSNINGIGARIELHTNSGIQIREVRSGESYGTMNTLMSHFGLANQTSIIKIVIKWPSGNVDEHLNPEINQSHLFIEGTVLTTNQFDNLAFNVFPNPTKNKVSILAKNQTETITMAMYNLSGKKVNLNTASFSSKTEFDITHLSSGIYFIHLSSGNKKQVHKLIKE